MKKLRLLLLTFSLLAIAYSCNNDDDVTTVSTSPEFGSLLESVSSLPNLEFLIEGVISDPSGIKSIHINYDPWSLDKIIVKDSLPKTYNLSYKFKVPASAVVGSQHSIDVTAVNSGGGETKRTVVVTLDKDIVSPVFAFNGTKNGATIVIGSSDEILFDIDISDRELKELKVESSLLNETIPLTGTTYKYTKNLNVDTPGVYEFVFTATDLSENETKNTVLISIVEDLKFLKMYLADVANDVALVSDLTGIPYVTKNSSILGEDGYVFSIKYYTDKANTEIRFIPQKDSFAPFAFGADPNNPNQLVIGTDSSVSPIILGDPGYYELKMDLRDLSYTVDKYTPPAAQPYGGDFVGVYMAGTGLIVGGSELAGWNPATALPFNIDPNNPHRYSQTVTFKNGVQGQFIFVGNKLNWNKFWRLNVPEMKNVEAIVPQGGENGATDTSDSVYTGTFLVTIDLHLLTFQATKI